MTWYTFDVRIEKEPEDEGYFAYSPSLPGCSSNGRSIEEARANIRDAIHQHLESLRAHGLEVPQAATLVHVEQFTVGIAA